MIDWLWFSVLVAILLVLDLGVLNRRSHVLSFREALTWASALVVLALAFGLLLFFDRGQQAALEYYTGYLIELSLSVDNLFVFILIFQYFGVPAAGQPRVLKWGIFGAMVLRGVMIALGAIMLQRFNWIIYVFGGLLVITGAKMGLDSGPIRLAPERNPVIRLARRLLPFSDSYDGVRFFSRTRKGLVDRYNRRMLDTNAAFVREMLLDGLLRYPGGRAAGAPCAARLTRLRITERNP